MDRRESNFELLRVIAILLVLLLHADFFALTGPSSDEIASNAFDSTLRILFQAICIPAVDIFVMISGWFGIKQSFRGFFNLIFQTLYYCILVYAVCIVSGNESISISGIGDIILATKGNWFIKSYILLYIIAPILNSYIESVDKRRLRLTIIWFFVFQFLYGWLFPSSTDYLVGGYSPLSFMGLYLLARYIRIHRPRIIYKSAKTCFGYLIGIFIIVTAACVIPSVAFRLNMVYGYNLLTYISPTTIVSATLAVITISKFKISSRLINRLAMSSFAVYLVFVNPNILTKYGHYFTDLYTYYTGVTYWTITIFTVIMLYIFVALIDSARIKIYNCICSSCHLNKTM